MRSTLRAFITLLGIALAVPTLFAVDVRIDFDKSFDFSTVKTWAWNPAAPGEVKMARTKEDDPEAARKRAEPIILAEVPLQMTKIGLQEAPAGPDVTLTYYLLLTTTANAQVIGQFLPGTTSWGIPPFAAATQSLEMMNKGALVLDIASKGNVVWRGVADAKIQMDSNSKKREDLLREGVRDLLRKFPPKTK